MAMRESNSSVLECHGPSAAVTEWPPQAELILSALEAGQFAGGRRERRGSRRRHVRLMANLRLFVDGPATTPWKLYGRDLHPRGMGFITAHRLPLGYGGMLELPGPDGEPITVACTLLRCREAAPGWFEGALYFNREQPNL